MSEAPPINVADSEALEAACEPGYWGCRVGGSGAELTVRAAA